MRLPALEGVLAGLAFGAHVLELGCGAGVPVARTIVHHSQELRVTGVDISEAQIELAKGLVRSDRA